MCRKVCKILNDELLLNERLIKKVTNHWIRLIKVNNHWIRLIKVNNQWIGFLDLTTCIKSETKS